MLDLAFARLGRLAVRFRWPIIIFWFALAALITLKAPNLDDVTSSDTADFVPADAPYRLAERTLKEAFPEKDARTSIAIVLNAPGGNVRKDSAWDYLQKLTTWLQSKEAPANITQVLSPAAGSSLLADAMIAPNGQTAIVMLYLNTETQSNETLKTQQRIETYNKDNAPPGVDSYLTGIAPIVSGYSQAAVASLDRTTGITIVLVVLILLLVYRSPVSPFVPLLTVGVSYLISRGLIAWVGASGATISSYVSVFLIVVLFGAGTDYCLFLISRFREEMADDGDTGKAAERTVRRVSETLISSAGTVIVGFVTMLFAEMGLFRNSGPVLALGIVVILLAGLTLTPALLALLGPRVFWPGQASHRETGRFYARLSALVAQHPLRTILIIVVVLAPFAVYATSQRITFDLLADLPQDYPARAGFSVLEQNMGGGQMLPLTIVLRDLKPENVLEEIDRWTREMRAVSGVADVRSLSSPLGKANSQLQDITRVDRQLSLVAGLIAETRKNQEQIDPARLTQATSALPFIREYLNGLEATFPQIAGDEDLDGLRQTLDGLTVAALTGRLNQSLDALQAHLTGLAQTFAGIEDAYYLPAALPKSLVDVLGGEDPLAALSARYLKADRTAARFEVIMRGNPFSPEGMNAVTALRARLPGGPSAVSGASVIMTDLRDTLDRDMLRAFGFVLLGVFLVLVFLLRALASPLYLILTILLSYATTIGITRLGSNLLFGTDQLTWWVPFFMFVLLVALGMDYNIFLMGRVREEVTHNGNRAGVHRALTATGAIITSAGIIMAGTFGAMMSSVIVGLGQLGFAVSVGVLLDTFVIRTALVPAIAILLDRWNWWPGRPPRVAESMVAGAQPGSD